MKRLIAVALVLAGTSAMAAAAQVKQGATACRNQQALLEIRAAEKAGDQQTLDWLYGGAACIKLPASTEVKVIASDQGVRRLRALNNQRTIELWVSADQIEPI